MFLSNFVSYFKTLNRAQASVLGFLLSLLFVILVYGIFLRPPNSFPEKYTIVVKSGDTITAVTDILYAKKIIRYQELFKALVIILNGKHGITAGDYYFEHSQNVLQLAWRMTHGIYDTPVYKVTIPEGFNIKEISNLFDKRFYQFDQKEFMRLASTSEGYLFPDTYVFSAQVKASQVVETLREQFDEKMQSLNSKVKIFGKPLRDVIIMASLLEEEARTQESRRMIAGILWKRLNIGMPLQVDSAFVYVNGKKDSVLLTKEDLRTDGPYNTYTRKGLPPGPISNPGIEAITDALNPIASPYFYYLSDKKGVMHYAVTHDEHVFNKDLYLR